MKKCTSQKSSVLKLFVLSLGISYLNTHTHGFAGGECFVNVSRCAERFCTDDDVGTPCSMARSSVIATPDDNYQKDPEYIPETPVQRIMGEIRAGTTLFLTTAAQLDQLV